MARLFPLRSEAPAQENRPRVVDLADEDADAVFGALSSTTARRIYTHLSEDPGTPSDVAEAIDSSIQNVRYHLEKLEDAGLIEVVDTWYSSRGNEMSVYATADGPLIVTSDRSRADQLREALSRFVGGLAVLLGASLYVQFGLERTLRTLASAAGLHPSGGLGSDDAGDAGDESSAGDGSGGANEPSADDGGGGAYEAESLDTETAPGDDAADGEPLRATSDRSGDVTYENANGDFDASAEGADSSMDLATEATDAIVQTLPPGLLFFFGGLVVLTVVAAWWYRSTY